MPAHYEAMGLTPAVTQYFGDGKPTPVLFSGRQCVIWRCDAPATRRGHCNKHYRQGLKEGGFE